MPRTFSLARLLLAITALCLLCGLAVKSRELALLFGPTVIVWIALFMVAPRPIGVTIACIVGALLASLVFTPARWFPISDLTYFMQTSIPWAIFAALFGGAWLQHDLRAHRSSPPDKPFAQPMNPTVSSPDSSRSPHEPDSRSTVANPKSGYPPSAGHLKSKM
jgi:hypothetical protein